MTEEKPRRLVRIVFDANYDDVAPAEVIFDTNRQWSTQLWLINEMSPDAKVIACARNPAWVTDSIEQLVRKNPSQNSRLLQNDAEHVTVYSRSEVLARQDRLIGYFWPALKEAYYSDASDKLLLVEYDILCQSPKETMKLIYQFIGEPWFEHDFDNVEYSASKFDQHLDTVGLHDAKRKVDPKQRRTVLPPDIFEKFNALSFWRDAKGSKARRMLSNPKSQSEANRPWSGRKACCLAGFLIYRCLLNYHSGWHWVCQNQSQLV